MTSRHQVERAAHHALSVDATLRNQLNALGRAISPRPPHLPDSLHQQFGVRGCWRRGRHQESAEPQGPEPRHATRAPRLGRPRNAARSQSARAAGGAPNELARSCELETGGLHSARKGRVPSHGRTRPPGPTKARHSEVLVVTGGEMHRALHAANDPSQPIIGEVLGDEGHEYPAFAACTVVK